MKLQVAAKLVLNVCGVVVLAIFCTTINFRVLTTSMKQADRFALAAALAFTALNIVAKAARWHLMMSRVAGRKLSFGVAVSAVLAGVASSTLTPGRSVDFAKPIVYSRRFGIPLVETTAGMLFERALDLLVLIAVFLGALTVVPLGRHTPNPALTTICSALFVVLLAGLVFPAKAVSLALRLLRAGRTPGELRTKLASGLARVVEPLQGWTRARTSGALALLSFAALSLEVLRFRSVMMALGMPLPLPFAALAFTASIAVGLVSLIPGGIGVTEAFQAAILTSMVRASNTPTLRSGVLLDRFLSYYLLILIGGVALMVLSKNRSEAVSQ